MMTIAYPYIPNGRNILYVPVDNPFMQAARAYALSNSLDDAVKTGSVVVKNGRIIGEGANGTDYHKRNVCERVRQNIPTGQGYELCEGCHPNNHSEHRAIKDAEARGFIPEGADLYLWGHWWACESCWNSIINAKIERVYLLKGSEVLFNKAHADNVLGTW